jgi:SAM-dependent methyltransferase
MSSEHYTRFFYERLRGGATRSAEIVLPILLKLLPVHSAVDVGCGDGSWLATLQKLGISDILGIDGDYVQPELLQIPPGRFQPMDLTKPFHLNATFDLAMSLEVAEHLPSASASILVNSLTKLAPAVLFSAAIPSQGGEHHLNEQWPEYWAELFQQQGFIAVDCIRKRIWQNASVEFWYIQNTILYVRRDLLERSAALTAEYQRTEGAQLSLVHPRQYIYAESRFRETLASAGQPVPFGVIASSRLLLSCLRNAIQRRLFGDPWLRRPRP